MRTLLTPDAAPTIAAMTRFQKLALATAATTVALFSVGGLVRGTGSGLGCSAWPACEPGRLFPSGTIHSLIEFSHRLLALAVILLASATALMAWLRHRGDRAILWSALAAVPLVLGQAVVGAIVVQSYDRPGMYSDEDRARIAWSLGAMGWDEIRRQLDGHRSREATHRGRPRDGSRLRRARPA